MTTAPTLQEKLTPYLAILVRLGTDLMQALAEHYADLPGGLARATIAAPADPTKDDRLAGLIFATGLKEANLPASTATRRASVPNIRTLAGQKPEYLAARLWRWRGDETIC